jgi:hypothetical protein
MSTRIVVLACAVAETMSTSSSRNSYAGDTNPMGHLRSPLLELYVRSLQNRSKEKIGCPASAAFGGRLRMGRDQQETKGRKGKLASDNQLQHDLEAA